MVMRLIKWVGDPPVLKADGWSVANWRYENARTIAVPGKAERIITPYDVLKTSDGREIHKPNGLSREYYWHRNTPNFVLEVDEADARIILSRQPHEFRDVTDVADPSTVTNTPIILQDRPAHPAHEEQDHRIVVPSQPVGRPDFLSDYRRRTGV